MINHPCLFFSSSVVNCPNSYMRFQIFSKSNEISLNESVNLLQNSHFHFALCECILQFSTEMLSVLSGKKCFTAYQRAFSLHGDFCFLYYSVFVELLIINIQIIMISCIHSASTYLTLLKAIHCGSYFPEMAITIFLFPHAHLTT